MQSQTGTSVISVQADICSEGSVARALSDSGIKASQVRGVFHGAACFDGDALFSAVEEDAFFKTMAPQLGSKQVVISQDVALRRQTVERPRVSQFILTFCVSSSEQVDACRAEESPRVPCP